MKPIRYSDHARLQMVLRGATEEEVTKIIRAGKWEIAKMGKNFDPGINLISIGYH